jgi:hypothetical protein
MTLRCPASTRALTTLAAPLAALLAAAACAGPANATTQAHPTRQTKHQLAAARHRVTHAQSTSISSALQRSTGLKPSQVGTRRICDTARKGHAVCNLEALVNRRTHQLLHPHIAREHAHLTRVARHGRNAHSAGVADDAPASASEPSFGTPAWLQQAYDTTWLSANRGSGDTVAVVDAYDDPTAASDLASYRSHFGLPACTIANGCFTEINQDSQTQAAAGSNWPASNNGWLMETSMDLAAVSAMCPNCHIVLVEATTDSYSDLVTAVGAAAHYSGVDQVTNSWGVMYPGAPSPLAFGFSNVSIIASSGDTGYQLNAGPQYPSSAPNVVSAGGTSLSTGSASGYRGFTETTWAGSGSTCDTYYPKPSYQHGNCNGRAASDVSADADPNTGLAFIVDGSWTQAGGTSLSSPLIAGFEAVTQPTIKTGQWAYSDASLLDDITLGNNDTAGEDVHGTCSATLAYICHAGAGYDGPTGSGAILGDIATGGPGIAGPDVCASGSCNSSSEGYVSAITANAVQFKAAVYRNGLATSYYWQYGTTTSFGGQSPTVTAAASAQGVGFNTVITGLAPSTTYHYRLVATNADGSAYGYTYSFETAALPANTTAPTITGTAAEGQALVANVGAWTPKPTSYSYQWQRNTGSGFVNIAGATAWDYTAGTADLGATIDVIVTAHDAMGAAPATSAATGAVASGVPANTSAPTIPGTLKQGVSVGITVGTWSPKATTYSYQWQRNTGSGFVNISGATAWNYTPGVADLGATLQAQVTGHNAYGSATAVASASGTVASGAPANTVAPTITGTPARGVALGVNLGTWAIGGTPSYQWQSCASSTCTAISGATGSTYVPVLGNEGDTLKLVVTATNAYGHTSVTTAASAVVATNPPTASITPTISGSAIEGDLLTVNGGTWGPAGVSVTVIWKACSSGTCTAISGATGVTFRLTAAQLGDTIEVQLTGTNPDGSLVKTSVQTGTVTA